MTITADRAAALLKDVYAGAVPANGLRLLKQLPPGAKGNRNFLGAAASKPCPARAHVAVPVPKKPPPAAPPRAPQGRKSYGQIMTEQDGFRPRPAVPPRTRSLVGEREKLQHRFQFAHAKGLQGSTTGALPSRPPPAPSPPPFATQPVQRFGSRSEKGESGMTAEQEGLLTTLAADIQARRQELDSLAGTMATVQVQPIASTDARRRQAKQMQQLTHKQQSAESALRVALDDVNTLVGMAE